MRTITEISTETPVQLQQLDNMELPDSQQAYFLKEVLESLQDGILILNKTGDLIYTNTSASRIFAQFNQDGSNSKSLPPVIGNFCKSLLEKSNVFSKQVIILSNEVVVDKTNFFRVRARWINLDKFNFSYLLVIIENKHDSLKNIVLAEVKKYELTPRESEIWYLYRAKFSYKEIAAQLYITVNTVKKHMKNIHAKRQAFLNCEN